MSEPGYGYPRPRNGFGIAALVLGLFALLLCWTVIGGVLFGLLALIFGLLGRGRAKRGEATNGGMSIAGVVLGIVGILLSVGLVVLLAVLGTSIINSPTGQNYQQCLEQSGGDIAKIQQCAEQFSRQFDGAPN